MSCRAAVLAVAFAIAGAAAPAFSEARTYAARNRPAAELAGLLMVAMGPGRPRVSAIEQRNERAGAAADEKSGRVIVDGATSAVADALRLLGELDVPAKRLLVTIEITAGPPRFLRTVWRARQRVNSGMTARTKVDRMRGITLANGPAVGRLSSTLTATVVEGGAVDVRGSVELDLKDAPIALLGGQARLVPGKPTQIAEVQIAHEVAVGLTVTVEIEDSKN